MVLSSDLYWGTKTRLLLGLYEQESVRVCKSIIKPGMNVLDVGAHVGYYSRLFSDLVGTEGRIWAFEPDPETYKLLAQNVHLPRYQNIIPVQKAVSDTIGLLEFFVMTSSGAHSLYNVTAQKSYDQRFMVREKITVESITIDDFLAGQGNPDIHFIKIDIEGGEPRAFIGMRKTISRAKYLTILVEFNCSALESAGVTPSEFLGQLGGMGFQIKAICSDGALRDISEDVLDLAKKRSINLLCTKT